MAEIWDDILTPAELTASARGYVDAAEEEDITAALLPSEAADDIRVEFEVRLDGGRTENVAPVRSWDAESAIGSLRAPGERRYAEVAPVSLKVLFREFDRLRRLNQTDHDSVEGAVQVRIKEVTDAIVNRLRALRSEALLTGQLAINENGVVQNVDFGRRPDFTTTADTPWDDPSVDWLTEYESWVEVFSDENGVEPEVGVIGRSVAAALQRSESTSGLFADGVTVTLAGINQLLAERGLPGLVLNQNRKVLSQDHLILAVPGTDALGSTVWGPTAEAQDERYGIEPADQAGIAVGLIKTTDPIQWWVHGAAAYLPVLKNANLSLAAQVLGTP